MKRKIDEVIKAVDQELRRFYRKNTDPIARPDIDIYMDVDFWSDCMSEACTADPRDYEFSTKGTIHGFPVWRVMPFEKTHPPFVVVGKLVNKEEER